MSAVLVAGAGRGIGLAMTRHPESSLPVRHGEPHRAGTRAATPAPVNDARSADATTS